MTSARDSQQISMAYTNMAIIQSSAGDYFGSQESLIQSLRYLDANNEKNRSSLVANYNELGAASINLKRYDDAIGYFNRALKFTIDSNFQSIIWNNEATAFQRKKLYAKALTLYRRNLKAAGSKGSSYARLLTNLAKTKFLNDSTYHAAPELLKALKIRQSENDLPGQSSSYLHLVDYYTHSRPDSALLYAGQAYKIAHQFNNPDDQLEALQRLIKLAPVVEARRYFALYEHVNDSLQTARNAAKNQFALIRYDAEKNKSDNFRLQKDNADKKYQIIRQQLLLGGAVLLLVASSIIAALWYRKRKERLELEAQQALQEYRLKTSKKVHDVVANGLYRIMTEIEYEEAPDKEALLDKIESLYEQSRDISYDKEPISEDEYVERVANLLHSFVSDEIAVVSVGNDQETWAGVGANIRSELRHILLELMINMKKHSQASQVAVRFERKGKQLLVYYTDNGIGLPTPLVRGNGMVNTGTRINGLEGQITFENSSTKGLQIKIIIPAA
ncbi:sensor histidine kinase [Mucilaginibacter koreensis]